jgi:hypothetical protein
MMPGLASRLLVVVQPSSEPTLDPVRRDNSFPEKQESQLARLLAVRSGRVWQDDSRFWFPRRSGHGGPSAWQRGRARG